MVVFRCVFTDQIVFDDSFNYELVDDILYGVDTAYLISEGTYAAKEDEDEQRSVAELAGLLEMETSNVSSVCTGSIRDAIETYLASHDPDSLPVFTDGMDNLIKQDSVQGSYIFTMYDGRSSNEDYITTLGLFNHDMDRRRIYFFKHALYEADE